jgi:thioester reductase-like protein
LGCHILKQLLENPDVDKVFCFVRTFPSGESARERLASALKSNQQSLIAESERIIAWAVDFSQSDFSLTVVELEILRAKTTHIIHCAWPVNFALPISSFSPHLACLQALLSLSLSVTSPEPAHVLFCSSIGTAMASKPPITIAAAPLNLFQASPTGYARSKNVAEHIIENAVKNSGAKATILRIGQIVPSRNQGSKLWNPSEAIPLMIRSALVIGALPDRVGSGDLCSWLEADVLAKAIMDISVFRQSDGTAASNSQLVYNLVHPRPFSWRDEFLPALRAAGLKFETVRYSAWLERLSQSSSDVMKNPSRKLLGVWEEQYHRAGEMVGDIKFDTGQAQQLSQALAMAESVVDADLVQALVSNWRNVW